jgi:ABC-type transporter Mla MlaB component
VFRLSQSQGPLRTTIRIYGSLAGEYARLAEQCCRQALAAGKRVQVLLEEVTAIDESGRQLLLQWLRHGVRLRAFDLYCKELLKVIRRSIRQPRRKPGAA